LLTKGADSGIGLRKGKQQKGINAEEDGTYKVTIPRISMKNGEQEEIGIDNYKLFRLDNELSVVQAAFRYMTPESIEEGSSNQNED
jgi:hypothetical protein